MSINEGAPYPSDDQEKNLDSEPNSESDSQDFRNDPCTSTFRPPLTVPGKIGAHIQQMTTQPGSFQSKVVRYSAQGSTRLPWPRESILRLRHPNSLKDPTLLRDLVVVAHAKKRGLPTQAVGTKIGLHLVSPEALDLVGMRYAIKDDCVIVLQALSKKSIKDYVSLTKYIRGKCLPAILFRYHEINMPP
jgi:hypothetical protein